MVKITVTEASNTGHLRRIQNDWPKKARDKIKKLLPFGCLTLCCDSHEYNPVPQRSPRRHEASPLKPKSAFPLKPKSASPLKPKSASPHTHQNAVPLEPKSASPLKPVIASPHTPKKHRQPNFNSKEQEAILRYIVENNAYGNVGGNKLWKAMKEAEVCKGRSAQSMRNHYLKKLEYVLETFSEVLTPQEIKCLRLRKPVEDSEVSVELLDSSNLENAAIVKPKIRKVKRSKTFRKPYSEEDDRAIINFINDNNGYELVKGRLFWERMAQTRLIEGRTWQALKERFQKHIYPTLDSFALDDATLKLFNDGWNHRRCLGDALQEKQHNQLIQGVEGFNPDSLRKTETQEKVVLPKAEDVQQEKTQQALLKGVEQFDPSQLRHAETQEKVVLPDKDDVLQEKTHQNVLQGVESFNKSALKHADTKEKLILPDTEVIAQEKGHQQLVAGIESFDTSKLKHTETQEKNPLPTQEAIQQEKSA